MQLASIRKKISKLDITNVLRIIGLDTAGKIPVCKYSLGMRQRLGLAQSFMENQELLILDEPMNGLDQQGVLDARELFLKLKAQGRTIIIASHNLDDIEILCDTVHSVVAGAIASN